MNLLLNVSSFYASNRMFFNHVYSLFKHHEDIHRLERCKCMVREQIVAFLHLSYNHVFSLEHAVIAPNRDQNNGKYQQISQRQLPVVWNRIRQQDGGQSVHFMRYAYENERSNEHIERWKSWQQNEHPVPVGCQPNVVLADKQLQRDSAEPGKEGGIASPQNARNVSQQNVTDDRDENHVRVNFLAVLLVSAEETPGRVESDANNGGQR